MPLKLTWKGATSLPVDGSPLLPEYLAGASAVEVARRTLLVGNRPAEVGDLFDVRTGEEGAPVALEGDLRCVEGLGRSMAGGTLFIRGRAGSHVGSGMLGGTIEIEGDAGDWAGAEMRGGFLRVHGSAGGGLGAAYPGSRLGMRDGVVLVHGRAGADAGRAMRRGLIAVRGDAGPFAAGNMVAGSLFVFGRAGEGVGLGMKRGTVGLFGGMNAPLPLSFAPAGRFRFPFLAVYLRQLAAWGFPVDGEVSRSNLARYNGDLNERGRGEVLALA